jgi:hypothetical protein
MADKLGVYEASALIYTGVGQLTGLVISCAGTLPAKFTIYDNTSAAVPKLIGGYVLGNTPLIIFFDERFAPTFLTGLYLELAAWLTATVWTRQL